MKIITLTKQIEPQYFVCLEEWNKDLNEVKSIKEKWYREMKEKGLSFSSQWNIIYKQGDDSPRLEDYVREIKLEYESKPYVSLYAPEEYGDYVPMLAESENIPLKINSGIASNIYVFVELIKKVMKVFLIVGIFYLLFFQLKKGKIEFRADKSGVVHLGLGKISMEENKLKENIKTFYDEIIKKKPTDLKGEYINSMYISSTMSPGIKINTKTI